MSRDEKATADIIENFLIAHNYSPERDVNNIWLRNRQFDAQLPTILLNAHHDTVKPNASWTYNPFEATVECNKITGLGSNDDGASLVSLLATFIYLDNQEHLPYNLIFCASAEEEVSGKMGMEHVLPLMGHIDLGIVGEPTRMQMAVAEKGLMVIDCKAVGKSGHAARNEGDNAIYKAIEDINWFRTFRFEKETPFLGPIKMTVTIINAGTQHNIIPDECTFMVDVRTNECYTNREVFEIIKQNVKCEVSAHSFRLNSSSIDTIHPVVIRGKQLGLSEFGSPTMSDKVFMHDFPSLKIGPGDSARSHTANEYIFIDEIEDGIDQYISLLKDLEVPKVK